MYEIHPYIRSGADSSSGRICIREQYILSLRTWAVHLLAISCSEWVSSIRLCLPYGSTDLFSIRLEPMTRELPSSLQEFKEQMWDEAYKIAGEILDHHGVDIRRELYPLIMSTIDQTFDLIEQMVPEKLPTEGRIGAAFSENNGWNGCRAILLSRLHTFRGGEITKWVWRRN